MKFTFDAPDECLKKIWRGISVQVKFAFFGTIIIGLMTHLYQFTNKLYNYDELANMPAGYGTGAESGRWFLTLLGDKLAVEFGNYSIPLLNGMISVLLLAVSAALVVDMFRVKSKFFATAIGGFMVAFPAVVCSFYFMYTVVFYYLALFMSVLAAYLVVKFPKNILLHGVSVVLIACAIGTYQSYYSNTACLLLMMVIMLCVGIDGEKNWKEILMTAVRYLAVLILGMVLYFVLNKFFLAFWGMSLNSYQGIDSMGQITPAQLFDAIKTCYKEFIGLCHKHVSYLNPTSHVKRCFVLIMLIYAVGAFTKIFCEKGCIIKKVFLGIGFILIPVGSFLVYIMVPNGWVYTLMEYSVVFVPIFGLIWAEHYTISFDKKEILRKMMQWTAALCAVVMLVVYIWYGNGCYLSLEYTKYHDMAYYETMVTQIKSAEGYRDELPVALIGDTITDETHTMGSMMGLTFGMDGKIETNINSYTRTFIITKLLGFAPRFCGYEEIQALMENEEVKEMPCYPDAGSIKVINDTVVVKIIEIPES